MTEITFRKCAVRREKSEHVWTALAANSSPALLPQQRAAQELMWLAQSALAFRNHEQHVTNTSTKLSAHDKPSLRILCSLQSVAVTASSFTSLAVADFELSNGARKESCWYA